MGGTAFVVHPLSPVIWRAPVTWGFATVGHARGYLDGATVPPKKSVGVYCGPLIKVWGEMVNFWPFFAHIPPQFSGAGLTHGHLLSVVLPRLRPAYFWSAPEFIRVPPNLS